MSFEVLTSLIGILAAIVVLILLAYRNVHPLFISLAATIIIALVGRFPVWPTITTVYMTGVGSYLGRFMLLFVAGGVLGSIYQSTGAGITIADWLTSIFGIKHVMLSVFLFAIIVTVGGISGFVAFFAVYPIALALFKKANINMRLLPAVAGGGMWTVAHVAPFTPSISNQIAMDALGTTSSAGWLPGLIYIGVASFAIIFSMNKFAANLQKQGIGFDSFDHEVEVLSTKRPGVVASFLPIVAVIASFNILKLDATASTWVGVFVAIVLFYKIMRQSSWLDIMGNGAKTAIPASAASAFIVGFGNIILLTPFYSWAINWVETVQMNPYILAALASFIFAAIVASASGATILVYQTLAPTFLKFGAMGYRLDWIHRVTLQSVSAFDSMPYCGPIIAFFNICHVDHKTAYKYLFFTCNVIPFLTTILVQLPFVVIFGRP